MAIYFLLIVFQLLPTLEEYAYLVGIPILLKTTRNNPYYITHRYRPITNYVHNIKISIFPISNSVNRLTPWVNRLTQDRTRFLANFNSVNRLTPWVNRLTQTEQQFLRNHNSVNRLTPWVNRLTQAKQQYFTP